MSKDRPMKRRTMGRLRPLTLEDRRRRAAKRERREARREARRRGNVLDALPHGQTRTIDK